VNREYTIEHTVESFNVMHLYIELLRGYQSVCMQKKIQSGLRRANITATRRVPHHSLIDLKRWLYCRQRDLQNSVYK
jgi:hypothetical protein